LYICLKYYDMNDKYAPAGTKRCESKCDKEPIMTPKGPIIVCHGCKRIVIDNRKKPNL